MVKRDLWIKNIPEDTYQRLRQGWDRGAYRNLWPLRRKWPQKEKYLMLQDLTFNKFFKIHGREVGKGPSNILTFLAQILSKKPSVNISSLLFFSRSIDGSSSVIHIPINSEGAFTKEWPGGFFNERAEVLTS